MNVRHRVRSKLSSYLAFAALAVSGASAHAQRCRDCVPGEDTVPRSHLLPGLGVHVGAPQKASIAGGVVIGEDWRENGRDHSRNVGLWVEPGLSGGRASVAYISHGYGSFGSGFAVGASVLRTWKDPWIAKENLTYIGGDVMLWPIVFVGPRIGLFRSVTSGAENRWFVSFDFGFGL
jgi:hypothetical protein